MEHIMTDKEKIESLINYYKKEKLLIVGLNDSQGVNTTSTVFKKGLLEYIAAALTSGELTPEIINAFSLTMNKTEHIDYFIQNNVSLREIKLSQTYSAVSALKKICKDIGLPEIFSYIGNMYKFIYSTKPGDENIKIASSLKEANEPIVIYSSGANDLMRAVGANPARIKHFYKKKDINPNYNYSLKRTKDPLILTNVINSIKKNYETIYGVNHNTNIYTLGAYIPKSLNNAEMDIFRDLIIQYNKELEKVCKEYGVTFIDTEEIGKVYNKSNSNYHITTAGHNVLANHILGYIYENKIGNPKKVNHQSYNTVITDKGALGVKAASIRDYNDCISDAVYLSGFTRKRQLDISKERKREVEIFQKVLKNR